MNRGFSTDTYRVSYHGYAHSHMDALCHILYKDQTYNGYARAEVNTEEGLHQARHPELQQRLRHARHSDRHPAAEGPAVSRAGHAGLRRRHRGLGEEGGHQGVVRRRAAASHRPLGAPPAKLGPWNVGQNAAGLHASVAAWLKERGVALIGSDAALDVVPSLVEGINLPVHTLAITALGLNILDNQDLEAVGELAAAQKRWEFMLTVAPVPVTGGTGFPVNALATF